MKKQWILGLLGCALTFTACNNDAPGPVNDTKTINSLFQELKPTPQTFTVTAGTTQTITGAKGTKITFHPQSFKDVSGNIITGGSVKIELTEMYKAGDMIANRVTTTTAAQQLLTSGGSVNIRATLNEHEVFTNNYGIAFKQSSASESPMALFTGYQVTDNTGTNIKWNDDSTGTVLRTAKDPVDQTFYYAFDTCTSFNWINCDYFYNVPGPKTDITVVSPDSSYNLSNTQVFVVFPAINGLMSMYAYSAASHAFTFGYSTYFLPVGTTIDIMILGSKNNQYFMDLHPHVVVTNNMTINFTPTNQSLSTIQAALSGL